MQIDHKEKEDRIIILQDYIKNSLKAELPKYKTISLKKTEEEE